MSQNRLSGKQRGKNFSDQENKQLCISWVRISQDPIRGTDQSLTNFWSAVLEDCANKYEAFVTRTPDGLRQRWGVISRAVQKFSGCYKAVIKLKESGTNQEDKINKAIHLYKRDHNEDFRYLECWEILKACPKFCCDGNPETTSPSTSFSEVPGTPTGTSTPRPIGSGPSTPRPIGRNAAKNALKSNELEIRRAEALERLAIASEQKNKAFEEYTAALKLQNRLKVATARFDGLDKYSAKILLHEKKNILREIKRNASNANATPSSKEHLNRVEDSNVNAIPSPEENLNRVEDSDGFEELERLNESDVTDESDSNAEYLDDQADGESEENDL